jgi:hypothetical protein
MTRTPTDLVVVLPGILGSTLRQDGHLVWAPSAGSVLRAIATLGRSLRRLRLPEDIGDDHPGDGVEAGGLMPDLHVLPGIWTPVKGYDRLLARLSSLGYRYGETCCLSATTGGCPIGGQVDGSPGSSNQPWNGGAPRADPALMHNLCSSATRWAGSWPAGTSNTAAARNSPVN